MIRKQIYIKAIITVLFIGTVIIFFAFFYSNNNTNNREFGNVPDYSKTTNKVTGPEKLPSTNPTPSPEDELNSTYPLHKNIYATMFWVGEKATDANDYIPNEASAWDKDWLEHFGGIDNPYSREGFYPKSFKPNENPFYFALPFNDFDESGKKEDLSFVPWYSTSETSVLKNKWIKISHKGNVCFGQWEDVGPFEQNDYQYVFFGQIPKNERAGIDLSPALRTCLKMATNDFVDWQFIDEVNVPQGPWKETVTISQLNW